MAVIGHYQAKPSCRRGGPGGGEGVCVMEPTAIGVLVTAVTGAAAALLRAWICSRVQRQQAREASRRDHVRCLPPGSRIVDWGERGMMIEVGSAVARWERPTDGRE